LSPANAAKHPGAPQGCIWRRQIQLDLHWISRFLAETHGTISRHFRKDVYKGQGKRVTIVTDASPWGIGGWISINGIVVQYFADRISAWDTAVLKAEIGSSASQQAFEALAMLVALRIWKDFWKHERAFLSVRADNMAALAMVSCMKAKTGNMSTLAREMALDIAEGLYVPNVVEHIPGVTNVVADLLSRKFQPGKTYEMHSLLSSAVEVFPGKRDHSWWRTLIASSNME
jgi:hypothetical protein